MRSNYLVALASLVVIVAALKVATGAPIPGDQLSTRMRQELAYREHGLRSAAAVTGTYISRIANGELGSPSSLVGLVMSADAIVMGAVESNRCEMTRDGFSIVTNYEVAIQSVLKGSLAAGDTVLMTVPGGRVAFEDGSWAQLDVRDLARPEDGSEYILFLRERATPDAPVASGGSPRRLFVPAFGGLGIYSTRPRGAFVYPAGNGRSMLGRDVIRERMSVQAFIARIRKIAKD